MSKQVKSPSKFISLEKLESLLINNCIGEGGQEYHQAEIESLINKKRTLKDLAIDLEPVDDEEGYQEYLKRKAKQETRELKNNLHNQIDILWLNKLLFNQNNPTIMVERL